MGANWDGCVAITRYGPSKNVHSSKPPSAGNLAGKKWMQLYKSVNLRDKSQEFESSPGHQNFLKFQKSITLYLGNFESYIHSNLRGNYR